jgi:hypothetical protein
MHINRTLDAWQVRIHRKSTPYFSKQFADSTYGSTQKALDAATDFLVKNVFAKYSPGNKHLFTHSKENANKAIKTGIPGVCIVLGRQKSGGIAIRLILYSVKSKKYKTIHIGSDATISVKRISTALRQVSTYLGNAIKPIASTLILKSIISVMKTQHPFRKIRGPWKVQPIKNGFLVLNTKREANAYEYNVSQYKDPKIAKYLAERQAFLKNRQIEKYVRSYGS